MTNYTSLRVTDLKDLLTKRKLPTNGNKAELVSRLEAADREKSSATPAAAAPEASTTAHLPSAEEYEINWDEDETTSTGGPKSAKLPPAKPETSAVKKPVTPAVGASAATSADLSKPSAAPVSSETTDSSATGKKPFTFKRLADQFTDLPSTKKTDTKKTGTTPATQAATTVAATPQVEAKPEAPVVAAAPEPEAAPEPSFAANLPPTPLESELERRKARAARFGQDSLDPVAADSLKKLERAARFGGAAPAESTESASVETKVGVKGLDQALPEHTRKGKRANDHGANVAGRGGIQKRARHGDRGPPGRGGRGPSATPTGKTTVVTGTQRRAGSAPGAKSVLDDPTEREKAERRKNRFGA
ncbi:hypothetical protein DFH27DRAFT_540528 [Peziza echinospora]|nr:hypothetical protein DFH27DRAFT_540528 [Peziza echinospora]